MKIEGILLTMFNLFYRTKLHVKKPKLIKTLANKQMQCDRELTETTFPGFWYSGP